MNTEPKIVTKEAFSLAGLKYHGQPGGPQVMQLWQAFGPRMAELRHVVHPDVCYGVSVNFDQASGELDYLATCEVSSPADLPAGMECLEVPAQTYAVFTTTLPEIGPIFEHIYNTWLPASGYQHSLGPEFELYDGSFDPQRPDSPMYLYIPVVAPAAA